MGAGSGPVSGDTIRFIFGTSKLFQLLAYLLPFHRKGCLYMTKQTDLSVHCIFQENGEDVKQLLLHAFVVYVRCLLAKNNVSIV